MTERFRPHAIAERVPSGDALKCSTPARAALPRRSVPPIAGLIAFEATARLASFSRAAQELALTQSAVSKRVRQLEEMLGAELLARSNYPVCLTDSGRFYLADVRRILARIETSSRALAHRSASRQALTIGVPPGMDTHWLIPRLSAFQSIHPGQLVNLVPRQAAIDFGADHLDGAIHCIRDTTDGVVLARLIEEVLLPVAAPELLNDARIEAPQDLLRMPLIHLDEHLDHWRQWFAAQGIEAPGFADGPTHAGTSLVLAAALHGHGVALVPNHMAADLLEQGLLAAPFERHFIPSGRLYAFSAPAERLQNPAIGHFASWLETAARVRPTPEAQS